MQHPVRAQTHAAMPTLMALAMALAGCASGPEVAQPAAPQSPSYTASALPERTASSPVPLGDAQQLRWGAAVPDAWWQALGSARLNAWIEQALQASPTVAAAQAALRQAQELQTAQTAATHYPQADLALGAQRQRQGSAPTMPGAAGQVADQFSASVQVRYRLDVSGGQQQALKALLARTDVRHYQLQAARLTLAGQITAAAIVRARLAEQELATQALLQLQQEQLEITKTRVRLGHAAQDAVWALQAPLEQTRATRVQLHQQKQQTEHMLAVLAGQVPGAAQVPDFTLAEFALPTELPVSLPSELVRQRPDILAAQGLLQAATADYGVAAARLYPQIQLSANLGSQALTAGALFGGTAAAWGVLAQLTQPLFNPALPAEKRAALAVVDAAAANYQTVVLDALRNVADVLRALEHDAQTLSAMAVGDASAQAAMQSMQRQYALGSASYVQLLLARQQAQQSRWGLIQAQTQRLADSAALYQAMGGGGAAPHH